MAVWPAVALEAVPSALVVALRPPESKLGLRGFEGVSKGLRRRLAVARSDRNERAEARRYCTIVRRTAKRKVKTKWREKTKAKMVLRIGNR